MDKRIQECLTGQASTEYILPFFWQHGEPHEVLAEEIDAMQKSGIQEFCVESRTHEEFGSDQWWIDMGFMLEEAKKRGMRVWLLDDKRFPTGYANNYIESHPELRAVRVRMEFRDFAGPKMDAAILPVPLRAEEEYVSIVAYRHEGDGDLLTGDGVQLLPMMENGLIWWDIPAGFWRVYYVIRTYDTTAIKKKNYVDVMSEESCKAMIHAVYEPHYRHFKEYFGNTFVGFFSDEPCFANDPNYYYATLGREDMYLPWNDQLIGILAEKTGFSVEDVSVLLPALWHEVDGRTAPIRECYMEAATEAYSRNLTWMLGDWCREHGVLYIGHIIEDQNAHQRLGCGGGHFFRALDGQDMGGCDIVLHQMIPGITEQVHTAALEGFRADPEFFNYTLAKLPASHGHIQPLKKGRAMCEIYGAFGWAEGLPQMKHMTDLMLVSGINHFVPHAFTPKYPDPDCPPHFYARGTNTQFPLFKDLMGYMQRVCHVLTGGVHQADAAVYYNAEAEWAGGKRMLQQKVCKELTRRQIDFDLIPQDIICETAFVKNGCLAVHEETYKALIVPYSQYLPIRVMKAFAKLAKEGVKIWFVDGYPDASSEMNPVEDLVCDCREVPFEALTGELEALQIRSIWSEKDWKHLRQYHVKRGAHDVYMLWNENINEELDSFIDFPVDGCFAGQIVLYDAWKNVAYRPQISEGKVRVRLAPSEAVIVCIGPWDENLPNFDYRDQKMQEIQLTWKAFLGQGNDAAYSEYPLKGLKNLARELPEFSGVIRYEALWDVEKPETYKVLELSEIGETAQLWINDVYCGAVVEKPYRFVIAGALKAGGNQIRIEVMANLAYRERDEFSTYVPLPITGLAGPVLAG